MSNNYHNLDDISSFIAAAAVIGDILDDIIKSEDAEKKTDKTETNKQNAKEQKPFKPTATASTFAATKDDKTIRPSYYKETKIEPIEVIRDWKLDFNLGNVIKYVARAGKKDPNKTLEDLIKAKTYLQFAIDELTNNK